MTTGTPARPFDGLHIGLSLVIPALLFRGGARYFRAVERRFADII